MSKAIKTNMLKNASLPNKLIKAVWPSYIILFFWTSPSAGSTGKLVSTLVCSHLVLQRISIYIMCRSSTCFYVTDKTDIFQSCMLMVPRTTKIYTTNHNIRRNYDIVVPTPRRAKSYATIPDNIVLTTRLTSFKIPPKPKKNATAIYAISQALPYDKRITARSPLLQWRKDIED